MKMLFTAIVFAVCLCGCNDKKYHLFYEEKSNQIRRGGNWGKGIKTDKGYMFVRDSLVNNKNDTLSYYNDTLILEITTENDK